MGNTADSIMAALEVMSKSKEPIDPGLWVDGAMKLTVLTGEEHDKLFDLEQKSAALRIFFLEGGMSAAAAKMHSEASEEHKTARRQKAKIARIEEIVRLAKLRGRMASDEMRMQ